MKDGENSVCVKYRYGWMKERERLTGYMDREVKSAFASGGWSNRDYIVGAQCYGAVVITALFFFRRFLIKA